MSFKEEDFKYKYDRECNLDDIVYRLLINSLMTLEEDGVDARDFYESAKADGEFDMRFVVNGKEIPAKIFLERFRESYFTDIEDKAREMVRERLGDLDGAIADIQDEIANKLYNLFKIEREEK